jgi:hypothetical protein
MKGRTNLPANAESSESTGNDGFWLRAGWSRSRDAVPPGALPVEAVRNNLGSRSRDRSDF